MTLKFKKDQLNKELFDLDVVIDELVNFKGDKAKEPELRSNLDKAIQLKIEGGERAKIAQLIKVIFTVSYLYVAVILIVVFVKEINLIEGGFLNAKDRSINATTLVALIAATFTQAGAGFFVLAQHYFRGKK